MKALFIKYRLVTKFILTFLLVYLALSVAYKFYLKLSEDSKYYPDYMTHIVAVQTQDLLNVIGYNTEIEPHPYEPSMKLIVKGKYLARVIEGCNSVSIIILFVSFIIAFSGKFKETIIFALTGSVLVYAVNVLRIVVLSIALYHYPWRKDILHHVVFPAIIYGMVFLLWMLWVNRFSKMGRNNG